MLKKTCLSFYILFLTFPALWAQESYKTIILSEILIREQQLIILSDSIYKGSSDSLRIASNKNFTDELGLLLEYQNTFSWAFDSLNSVSILKSKDGLIKIYTWILPATDRNSYSYFGFVQVYNLKTRQVTLYKLNETKYENEMARTIITGSNKWYGAVYYKMIEKKEKGKPFYTLLGWHGNSRKTTRKVIDVLSMRKDTLVFGKPVFTGNGKPAMRMVFEYTAQAVMKLNFDEKKKMIVFDRLSPTPGAEKNQYEFYGPDFRYDGLQFKKGNWVFKKDIDLRNPKSFDTKKGKSEKGKSMYDSGK